MSEEYQWNPLGEALDGKTKLSWQRSWTPRNTMEDPILREFSEKCDYFTLSKFLNLDIAIATIDKYLYIVVDWEQNDYAEHSNNSMSFRIEL
tara:strand:+ start:40 stop:315 length:276 start_codon:yes stop_codon:yes gene_type:complete